MNLCGWFPSSIVYNENTFNYDMEKFIKSCNGNVGKFALCFYAKFDVEIPISDLPSKLYHCTFDCYIDKIKYGGLHPKEKSNISSYPSRIYFAYNVDESINFCTNKLNEYRKKDNRYKNINLAVYELDTLKLNKYYKFMNDVNSDFKAVYCLEPIPFNTITLTNKIKIK